MYLTVRVRYPGIVFRGRCTHIITTDNDPQIIPLIFMLPFTVRGGVDKQFKIAIRQRFIGIPVNHAGYHINRLADFRLVWRIGRKRDLWIR